MKTTFRIFLPLIIICMLFALATCAPDAYDNAMLNISVNGNSARSASLAVLDVSIEEITHQITLTGPTGILNYSVAGGGNLSASVAAGTWRVDVTGYYGEEIYSIGTASVAVKAGQSSTVSVLMTVVWQEGDLIPPPGTELPQLPGTAWISGTHWFNALTTGFLDVAYIDPTWVPSYTGPINLPYDGYIVQWYVGGQLVQTDTDVVFYGPVSTAWGSLSLSNAFEVTEEYWNRDVFVIISHPDFYGVKSNSLRICKEISSSGEWTTFSGTPGGGPGFEWEGNSFILMTGPFSQIFTIGSFADPFNGYLDGGRTQVTLAMTIPTDGYFGIFAHIGPRGTVMNLQIDDSLTFSSPNDCYIGAVAGLNEGTIMNIAYDDDTMGGLITLSASGECAVGGITGHNKGIIKNCFVNIGMGVGGNDTSYAGGIAGINEGEIDFCWVNTNSTTILASNSAGGITGKNSKTINHCVVLGGIIQQIVGTGNVGRLWGTGNGTGRANWANNDNDSPFSVLKLQTGPIGMTTPVTIDPADDLITSKHGKGVPYNPALTPLNTTDAASEYWWKFTAGWGIVWDKTNRDNLEIEKPWDWDTTAFHPVLPY